ncbi:putative virion structural protein [Plesiomonas phage phiP4-7]|nr:putative virion structural protein [Plesiomonas phage phiP4-7]
MALIGYATEQELTEYAAVRGITLGDIKTPAQLLTLALDYIESFEPELDGQRKDADQLLSWPRTICSGIVPFAIKQAQIIAAIEIDKGTQLFNVSDGAQLKSKKAGPIEKEYFAPADAVTTVPQIDALMSPFKRGSGFFGMVTRV